MSNSSSSFSADVEQEKDHFYPVVTAVLGILLVLSNAFVFTVSMLHQLYKKHYFALVMCLCTSDMISGAALIGFLFPSALTGMLQRNIVACLAQSIMLDIAVLLSVTTLSLLSVDRYLAVFHATYYKSKKVRNFQRASLVTGVVLCLVESAVHGSIHTEHLTRVFMCANTTLSNILPVLFLHVLPCITISSFCNVYVYIKLGKKLKADYGSNSENIKLFRSALAVIASCMSTALCCLPGCLTFAFLSQITEKFHVHPYITFGTVYMIFFNGILNTVFFSYFNIKFNKIVRTMFHLKSNTIEDVTNSTVQTSAQHMGTASW